MSTATVVESMDSYLYRTNHSRCNQTPLCPFPKGPYSPKQLWGEEHDCVDSGGHLEEGKRDCQNKLNSVLSLEYGYPGAPAPFLCLHDSNCSEYMLALQQHQLLHDTFYF